MYKSQWYNFGSENHCTGMPMLKSSTWLLKFLLVGWLCFTSHRQRGHLETAPPCTVPCKGREAWQSITLPLGHTSSLLLRYKLKKIIFITVFQCKAVFTQE